jgi:serine/threonine protein kinase
MADPLINATIGPFIIRDLISGGGVAEVYRAEHADDRSIVAVKVMRPERLGDRAHVAAFQAEFAILQRIRNPGVPAARRQGEVKGRPCFIMDHVAGQPLHQLCQGERPLGRPAVFADLVGIVAHLHQQRILHADIKLENAILKPTGKVGLVDFGNAHEVVARGLFARLFGGRKPLFATPTYVAPELVRGGVPTFASDVYALGVCAFIILTGEPPFPATRSSGRVRANLKGNPPAIRSRLHELPARAAVAIDASLSKDPAGRPLDARQLSVGIRELESMARISTAAYQRKD